MSKYMRVPFAGQDESSLTPEQREMKQFALDNNKAVAAEAARRSEAARKAAKTRAENQRLQNKWEREQAEAEWLRREDALRAAGDDACAEVHVDLNAILYQWRGSLERAAQEAKNAAEGALEALVAKHGIDVVLGLLDDTDDCAFAEIDTRLRLSEFDALSDAEKSARPQGRFAHGWRERLDAETEEEEPVETQVE